MRAFSVYDMRMESPEGYERLNVNMIPKAAQALAWLMEQTGLNRTDVVNRALQLYRFTEEQKLAGNKLCLLNEDGQVAQVHVL